MMKTIIYNDSNLKSAEIDEKAIRVKGLFINSNNEILLSCCEDVYQFPGGHLEFGESLEDALKREVKEELGIKLEKINNPFLHIAHLKRNYRNSGKNRQNDIYYFLIQTEENAHPEETNLDEYEMRGHYTSKRIPLKDFSKVLFENEKNKNDYLGLTKEMLKAYEEVLELI